MEVTPTGAFLFIAIFSNMTHGKNVAGTLLPMTVTEGVTVQLIPSSEHEFLMTTREVAAGYGVTEYAIRKNKMSLGNELQEGKHFISAVTIGNGRPDNLPVNALLWTKRGIIRLGFTMRSERARLFRDWAEDLVLSVAERPAAPVPASRPRRINRLTPDRIIDLLSDVCQIEDKALRERIATKLKGGFEYGTGR